MLLIPTQIDYLELAVEGETARRQDLSYMMQQRNSLRTP